MATYTPVAYTTAANNTQIDFDVTFTFLRTTDVVVSVIDPSGNVLVDGSDYDAELQALNNGTFDMRVVAAGTLNTTQTPLAASHVISLKRNTDISQLATVFQDGASFRAADINALITQLFNKIQEVEVSSGEGIGLTDDLVAFDAENKPLRNLGTPTADNDAMRKVDIDSGIGPDITTVAGIAANVTTVAADTADIGTVASDITGTNTIGTVSSNIADVNTVATNIANVNTVAADTADIGTVAADIQVGGPDNIGTVATAIGDVGIVAGINGQVQTVAGAIANVNTVAADTADIGTVATNIANVNTVAGISSDVTSLAPQASNIGTLTQAANLTALQNAQTNAQAAQAALNQLNNKYHGSFTNVNNDDAEVEADIAGDANLTLEAGDLYFDTTNSKLRYYDGSNWYNAAAAQVINTTSLQNVGDVNAYASLTTNDFLKYDGTGWQNVNPTAVKSALSIAAGDVSGLSTVATTNSYNDLANLPTLGTAAGSNTGDFAAASHTHVISDVTNLQSSLDAKQDDITATSGTINAQALTTVVDSANVDVREAAVIDSGAVTTSQDLVGDAALYNVTGTGVVLSLDTTVLTAGTIVSIYANGYDVILRQTATTANQFGVVRLDGDTTTNRGGTGTIADTTVANGTLATITVVSSGEAVIAGQGVS